MHRLLAPTALCLCIVSASAAEPETLRTEIAGLDEAIAAAERDLYSAGAGLLAELIGVRIETLRLTRALIENRIAAEEGGASVDVVVPAHEPDPARADALVSDLQGQMQVVAEAEREAAATGGLMQVMAMTRVETEKLILAQLRAAYYEARYGIPMAMARGVEHAVSSPVAGSDLATEQPEPARQVGSSEPWADPDHPEIDYSRDVFRSFAEDGDEISGWWAIERDRAEIDDSPRVRGLNLSQFRDGFQMTNPLFTVRCSEGQASLVFIADTYISSDFRSSGLQVTYRIDDAEAVSESWSELTGSQGAGLFGERAERMIRKIYDADRLFLRITERGGRNHSSTFMLSGGRKAFDAVADACGFTTLELTSDQYRALQTLLNAAGFNAGAPDGQWGPGSRAAMRAFQAAHGLAETGAPDRSTLAVMGADF